VTDGGGVALMPPQYAPPAPHPALPYPLRCPRTRS
jgi:hypothetical protein